MNLPIEPNWEQAATGAGLRTGEVHVWYSNIGIDKGNSAEQKDVLSDDELKRAAGFRFERDADSFIYRRSLLRAILSKYVDRKPRQIIFDYSPNGKPMLAAEVGNDVRFSVSSSNDVVLVALAATVDLGVDVELITNDFPFLEIADKYFTPSEIEEIDSADDEAKPILFYSNWTKKEAYVKAVGSNLVDELPQRLAGVNWIKSKSEKTWQFSREDGWDCCTFMPEPFYVASIVMPPSSRTKFMRWQSDQLG